MINDRVFDHEMNELKEIILKMGIIVQGLIEKSVEAISKLDVKLAQEVINEDEKVDQLELEVDEKTIQLVALRQPEASDLRFLMTGMRISNDLERIGDLAGDIAGRTMDLVGKPLLKPLIDIPKMAKLSKEAVAIAINGFINKDAEKVKAVWAIENEVDKLRDQVHDELVQIMAKDTQSVSRAIPLLLISRHLERISDHATNIVEDVIYMVEGKVIKHSGRES